MTKITSLKAIQILDSRGVPTISCKVELENGHIGEAKVPSGASTGAKEALELRDNQKSFHGKSVEKAVDNINTSIQNEIRGMDSYDQALIDNRLITLDGTKDKSNLGANAILATSLAIAKAASLSRKVELHDHMNWLYKQMFGIDLIQRLPMPMLNILNGGEHADNNVDIQEFMIIPKGAKSFKEAMQWSSEIYWNLKKVLKQQGLSTGVGDEGGFAPNLPSNESAIQLIIDSIEMSNLKPYEQVTLSLDCAASEFFEDNLYKLKGEGKNLSSKEFAEYLSDLNSKYPISSIEDGMDEDDNNGWEYLTNIMGDKCQLVGDDLFVTNKEIFQKGIDNKIANSILIKLNQIGSLTETIETVHLANENNYSAVISHRSGETEDTTIADLVVGLGTGQIKTGAPCRSDRVAKYNRLLWIEAESNNLCL